MDHILPANVAIIFQDLPIFRDTFGNPESLFHDLLAIFCAARDKISTRQFDSLVMAVVTYTAKIPFHLFLDVYL